MLFQGVYRISFALAVFFLIMSVLSKCIPLIHRGGWVWKYLTLFLLVVIAFVIPNGAYLVHRPRPECRDGCRASTTTLTVSIDHARVWERIRKHAPVRSNRTTRPRCRCPGVLSRSRKLHVVLSEHDFWRR